MPWDSQKQNEYSSTVNNAVSQANTSLNIISSQSERAALKLAGAQEQIDNAKRNVEQKLTDIADINQSINNIIDEIAVGTQDVRTTIQQKKERSEMVITERNEAKAIAEVRKEQVQDLQEKNEGNYHTSWLGLWRPLASESRTGLFIASIVLGLIGLLSICFLMIDPIGKLLPAISNASSQYMPSEGFSLIKKK